MTELLYAIVAAFLFFCGFFLLQRRHLTQLIAGIVLISHAVNLSILLAAPLKRHAEPFPEGGREIASYADPLPQALILTAIVITFGLVAFAIVAQRQFYRETGKDDVATLGSGRSGGTGESTAERGGGSC